MLKTTNTKKKNNAKTYKKQTFPIYICSQPKAQIPALAKIVEKNQFTTYTNPSLINCICPRR